MTLEQLSQIVEAFADPVDRVVKLRLSDGTVMTLEEHAAIVNQLTE